MLVKGTRWAKQVSMGLPYQDRHEVAHPDLVLLTTEASLTSLVLCYRAPTILVLREQECSASVCWAQVLPQGFMNLFLNCYLMPAELDYF